MERLKLTIPELDPTPFEIGKQLGEGLDKRAFEVHWKATGEVLPLVAKRQHADAPAGRAGQLQRECAMQLALMDFACMGDEVAKLTLSKLALIIGTWVDADGRQWALQERVETGYSLHGTQMWGHLLDGGARNCGKRLTDRELVLCDWGIENVDTLYEMGATLLKDAA